MADKNGLGLEVMNPVPIDEVPQPSKAEILAKCGKAGWMVELLYPASEGQNFSWPLYMQNGFAGSIAVITRDPSGSLWVSLTRQWRPGHRISYELPAGNIGLDSAEEVAARILKSVLSEVGEADIVSAHIGRGVGHDVGREVSGIATQTAEGVKVEVKGPKLFIPCVLEVASTVPPRTHLGEVDEKTHTQMFPVEEAFGMMERGEMYDSITTLFLPSAINLVNKRVQPWETRYAWHKFTREQLETTMARAREILAQLGA